MNHSIVNIDGLDTVVTVFHNGEVYAAVRDQHPNFDKIVKSLTHNPKNEKVLDLFDLAATVSKKLEKVTERVSLAGGTVFFDGDPVHNVLTEQIVRFVNEGVEDYLPLVNFMEKVETNPNENSREQLYLWLQNGDFTITPSGDFVGYKGVSMRDGVGYSTRPAPAKDKVTVNGEPIVGVPVPNRPGDVVEMPRSVVDPNEDAHCSVGLHVGTFSYANSFGGGNCLEVHVNPRDVVSVTSDSNREKIRTCRYTVVDYINARYEQASLEEVYDDEDEVCPSCESDVICCYDDLCDSCGIEREDELAAEQEQEELNEGFSKGDTVKTVNPVMSIRHGSYPLGSKAVVVQDSDGDYVMVRFTETGEVDTWGLDRFGVDENPRDTRFNYLGQQRYPKGHPKAGQFIPKS